jgi:glycosyltransferase involved in cell wall biosynthesis
MKFIFVSSMSVAPWGGSEELWSQTALRLRQAGHEVLASVKFWPELSPKIKALADAGISTRTQQCLNHSVVDRAWHKTMRLLGQEELDFQWIRRQKADLMVISQGGVADGLWWMKLCQDAGLPYVAISQCNAEAWWPTDADATNMSELFSAAKAFFFVSRGNLELCERQIGKKLSNALVVRNPFNVSPEKPVPWPEETGVWRLACVARLDPFPKGQDLLFQALSQARWRERAVEVSLYGEGPCAQGLRRLADLLQLKTVHFKGHVKDIASIWGSNHILVLPSRLEGLPLVLVEAMWCGRPAVVTDVAGNTELCVDGETGFVAAAPSAEILEQTLETAWDRRHDWQKMGVAARSQVEKLIPKDPVGVFTDQLISCAEGAQLR